MKKFNRVPKTVEAIQYEGTKKSIEEVYELAGKKATTIKAPRGTINIKTEKGSVTAIKGDFIAKDEEGFLFVYKEVEFLKDYEDPEAKKEDTEEEE